jgi:hypothetical protein
MGRDNPSGRGQGKGQTAPRRVFAVPTERDKTSQPNQGLVDERPAEHCGELAHRYAHHGNTLQAVVNLQTSFEGSEPGQERTGQYILIAVHSYSGCLHMVVASTVSAPERG